jgi:hypothetical protein
VEGTQSHHKVVLDDRTHTVAAEVVPWMIPKDSHSLVEL